MGTARIEITADPHAINQHKSIDLWNGGTLRQHIKSSLNFLKRVYRTTGLINIRYDNSYIVGVPEFDGRRQTITGVYNSFNAELRLLDEQAGSPSRLNEKASLLVRLIGELFSFEEDLMREIEYAEFAAHKAKHIRFLETLHDEFERIQRGHTDMHDLSYVIGSWLVEHMRGMDKAFGDFIMREIGALAQAEAGEQAA